MNRYAFALRMARQDALRVKGRTALVLCMIGLPIGIVVALAVLRATTMAQDTKEGVPAPSGAEVAVLAMIIAMIVLQVVLLAGPAFVVDVRRRRRELALVEASGGAGRHLRAVVLASGLLLGGIAAVAGAALGIAAAAVTKQVAESDGGEPLGPFTVPWLMVAVTMLLGAGSGVLAAMVPAWQAGRMDVVAALAGRREPPGRSRRGWPIAGGVLVLAGVVVSLVGVQVMREFGAAVGAAAIIIGLVLACPWIVGTSGRLARGLPLPLRLAVRDAARNRARTAPAIAAIVAAVAGVTALAIGGASDFRQERIEYQAQLPMGSALVRPQPQNAEAAGPAIMRDLPGVPVTTLRGLPGEGSSCFSEDTSQCRSVSFSAKDDGMAGFNLMDNVVGGAREARLLLGRDDPAVTAALDAGTVVLFGAAPKAGGKVDATISYWADDQKHTAATVPDLPAVAAQGDPHVEAIVPPKVAERIAAKTGLRVETQAYGIDRADHRVTKAEQARLEKTMKAFAPYDDAVYVERGFTGSFGKVTLVLGAAAAILALGGTLIATSLAAADARPDLATLQAIGARPRTGRLLTMGQAGVTAAIGCWLGIAGGLVPGLAVTRPLTEGVNQPGFPRHGTIVDIPWLFMLVLAFGIPLVAAVFAGAVTGGRLPTTGRMAT
ncbi:FtsX-like permease family protein [Spirillospora sp. CA-128828]|uniref:FtsX-like permease family protein n=1 Tax=Spirillospora sp. CA-128828 TaxID=3240033 RepID=UPI003D8B0E62